MKRAGAALLVLVAVVAGGCGASGTDQGSGAGGRFPGQVALPAPQTSGGMSLQQAIAGRRSTRSFGPEPLSLAEVGQLLWAAQGVTGPDGKRAAPSAGALYPLELYVVTATEVLHYLPVGHRVELRHQPDLRPRLQAAAGGQPAVALTFDDGPSPESTPATPDLPDQLGPRAPVLLLRTAVRDAPELALEIARRGHEIGSHGMVHAHHLLRRPRWVLADAEAAVAELGDLGLRPRFFRPPHGQVAGATHVAARRVGCEVVLWSGWGREFAERRPEPVLERLTGALRPGAILLLHDSDACCPPGTTALVHAVLPGLAEALAERGAKVALAGRRAALAEEEARRLGGNRVGLGLTHEDSLARAVEGARPELGEGAVLVLEGGGRRAPPRATAARRSPPLRPVAAPGPRRAPAPRSAQLGEIGSHGADRRGAS